MKQLPNGQWRTVPGARVYDPQQRSAVATIQAIVAAEFDIPLSAFANKSRCRIVCWPRQIAMHFCLAITKLGPTEIGRAFGNRDHGTVRHNNAVVIAMREHDADARQLIQRIGQKIRTALFGDSTLDPRPSTLDQQAQPFFPR